MLTVLNYLCPVSSIGAPDIQSLAIAAMDGFKETIRLQLPDLTGSIWYLIMDFHEFSRTLRTFDVKHHPRTVNRFKGVVAVQKPFLRIIVVVCPEYNVCSR